MRTSFVKRWNSAPAGYFGAEAAGLRWLGEATGRGGVPVANVLEVTSEELRLEHLEDTAPSADAAFEFGIGLARTHDAGADAFGCAPGDWAGPGYFGPLRDPLPLPYGADVSWGASYADLRLRPYLDLAERRGAITDTTALRELAGRVGGGEFDDDDPPARTHGDLWSGNLMWTSDGVVLIDPAACGGHRETDLALLHLFGCPHLDQVLAGYQSVHPLMPSWQDRVGLHQLHCLLAHALLFGGSYGKQCETIAERYNR